MIFNGEFWEGNTSVNTAPENTLTAGKLLEMMRRFEREFPPLPSIKFDVYGSEAVDSAYEINCPEELRPPASKGRRMLIVPKAKLDQWAYELRRHGAEVRVEPRIMPICPIHGPHTGQPDCPYCSHVPQEGKP